MRIFRSLLLFLFCIAAIASASEKKDEAVFGTITYVASEGVYINAGTDIGLESGDSLIVLRKGKQVGIIIINNLSSRSSSALVADSTMKVMKGDVVVLPGSVVPESDELEPRVARRNYREVRTNDISGDVSIQSLIHRDMTGSSLHTFRPGLRSRIKVDNLFGTGAELRWRHRTRLHHRSRTVRAGQSSNEWRNNVYELSITSNNPDNQTEWGVGRIIAPYVRGIGFVDGAYMAYQIAPNYKVGFAVGGTPDRQNSEPSIARKKLGLFVAYERGEVSTSLLSLSAAMSGDYFKDTLSREFIYLQGTYSMYNRLTVYQSVEVDYNRSWRYDREQKRLSFTNYFANATFYVLENTSLYFSYDQRNRIRYYETRHLADSLFDQNSNKGIRGGVSTRLWDRLSLRGNIGIRFRNGLAANNRTISFFARLTRFPLPRHTVSWQLSIVESQFTTGYRSVLGYRLPVTRALMLNLNASGYFYSSKAAISNNYWIDASTAYYFRNSTYLSAGYHQYLDKELRSAELYTEIGRRF